MKIAIQIFIVSFSILSYADSTSVIFFGGYGSSKEQMACWVSGANNNAVKKTGHTFEGIQYPAHAGADSKSAITAGAGSISRVVNEINQHPNRRYVIAGHSSGAALANRVAELVKNPNQIELVDLDGFAPSKGLQRRVRTTCWYAVNPKIKLQSRNAASMRNSCENSERYTAVNCKTQWCLHFSLVNMKAPSNLGTDFKTNGYKGCSTNLDWLANSESTTSDQEVKPSGALR